jgi:nucleotide-binding universal stress UspA family protein
VQLEQLKNLLELESPTDTNFYITSETLDFLHAHDARELADLLAHVLDGSEGVAVGYAPLTSGPARANAVLASHGLFPVGQKAVQGRPTKMILEYAQRMGAELIVLSAEGPLKKLGAGWIVDHAPCATLVARARL